MAAKSANSKSQSVAVIGSHFSALQTALTLAKLGINVELFSKTASMYENDSMPIGENGSCDWCYAWPLSLEVINHPRITVHTLTEVDAVEDNDGSYTVNATKYPRFINPELCTACGQCEAECSSRVTSVVDGCKIVHSAIHSASLQGKTAPSAFVIDKREVAPCSVGCPLHINIQGFVSLISKGKPDKALDIITESAPFAGVLGRVCSHPCELKCNRGDIDEPVSIRSLHRYAADNASGKITFTRKAAPKSKPERIAIIGSGPAGLSAAWELTRRGYAPTVFESHSVIGGTMATGIPRFRLPREVREREIEAITSFGIDVRTGITVGRDITIAYLKERGYQAFFLAIGAQQNTTLNIPGENLKGVVDCMSLLIALNLKLDTFVGSNIVIIGDGNSAIDSARAAIRKSDGSVKILSWTTPEEITANSEEVNEAILEGVQIEYCVSPVEILGQNGKVTGLRCRRNQLTDTLMSNGRHLPEQIPGTEFEINADHVIVAIGQSPNSSQLNIPGLETNGNGVIKVDSETLATSIDGVFSGGDCTPGLNMVVQAVSDGLKAAESIDRYLQGIDLKKNRDTEPPVTAKVNPDEIEIAPYKRAEMPSLSAESRSSGFEETTTGLTEEMAHEESLRCLNCALCSQCMECVDVCQLNAVNHDDSIEKLTVSAKKVFDFSGDAQNHGTFNDKIEHAKSLALEAAMELGIYEASSCNGIINPCGDESNREKTAKSDRTGIFLCKCGDSTSSVLDFARMKEELSGLPDVLCVNELMQSCTRDGAEEIAALAQEWHLDRIVLAACRCCNEDQICYSCTDRRIFCKKFMDESLVTPCDTIVEYCNIREQCAWSHRDNPEGATLKAIQVITSAVRKVQMTDDEQACTTRILPEAVILGSNHNGILTAGILAKRGYRVKLFTDTTKEEIISQSGANKEILSVNLETLAVPDTLDIAGKPGQYDITVTTGNATTTLSAGAIVLTDINGFREKLGESFTARIVDSYLNTAESSDSRPSKVTIGEDAGIFIADNNRNKDENSRKSVIARIMAFLNKGYLTSQSAAITIREEYCRGCGDCHAVCPFIVMNTRTNGIQYASIEKSMCLGCGLCLSQCSTGAITQTIQADGQITAALRSLLL